MKDFISETKKYIQSFSRNEEFSLIAARLKINLCQPRLHSHNYIVPEARTPTDGLA